MAPPNARRTGFSRRAQYGTFFGYLAAIAGALAGALVLVVSLLNPGAFAALRGSAADAAAPAGQVVAAGRSGGQTVMAGLWGYLSWGPRHAAMEHELQIARVQLAEARALADENRRLKALAGLAQADSGPVAFARLIDSTASSPRRFATLSVGRDKGVTVGMPVRSPAGVVGRVLEVSARTARILLITDPESLLPVMRGRDGVPAFAQGRGDGTLQVRLVSLGINPLKVGDVLVTSGSGGLYAPGMAVGVVVSLTRDGAIARVLSDPTQSAFVAIYPPYAISAGMPEALVPVAPATPPSGKPAHKKKPAAVAP
ncbi:rod shape-determining protein MreC [Novosphingobium bradum]|uniref:Cell shape-determining protein MreC n=1 Tax=Novosphingobium bradum TaxID=1737444 RepID=A0ABV7IS41_9SPHN